MKRRRLELGVAVLSGITAVGAMGGAVYGLRLAPAVPRAWLKGSPFSDYRLPSVVLGVAVGGSTATAAIAAWRASDAAPVTSTLAGAVLTAWIIAQVRVIGLRSPLQPLMAAVGVSLIVLGKRLALPRGDLGAPYAAPPRYVPRVPEP